MLVLLLKALLGVQCGACTTEQTATTVLTLWQYFWKRTLLLRFYVVTPVLLKDQVFWDVTQCRRVISYRRLKGS